MNLAKSSLKLFVASFGGAVLVFLGLTFFSRSLSPQTIGAFFLFRALLGFLSILGDIGVRGAIEKRLSEGSQPGQSLSAGLLIKVVPFVILSFGILLFDSQINSYVGQQSAVLLVVSLFLRELYFTILHILKGELRPGETSSLRFLNKLCWTGMSVALISIGYEYYAILYSIIFGYSVSIMWGIKKISIRPKTPRKTHILCIFNYSKFHFVGTLGGYAYSWIDILIIGYFLTNADVSAYEFAWRVTEFVILFSNAIALTTLPQVSRWDADGETKKIEQLIENGVTASLFFVIPAFFGTVLLAEEILQFVFGPEYTIAGIVLVILMFEALFQAVHKVLSRVLLGMDKPSLAARATAVSILLNIILNIVFVVSYGLPGAAAATAISFMMNTALHGWFLSRYITISFNIFDIVKCVLSAIGMTTVLLFIQSNLAIVSLPLLMVVVAVGGSVYLIFAMAFSSLRDKIFDTLGQIIDHPVA